MKKLAVVTLVLLALPLTSSAKGEDLKNCRFSDGTHIVASLCERYRQERIEEQKRLAEHAEQNRIWQENQDARRRKQEEEVAERRMKWDLAEQERIKKRDEMQAAQDAEDAKYRREEARREKLAAEQTKSKKERCGEDYGTPRIGMTLARAQECAGTFKLKGQINRADGVVSTYVSRGMYLHAMDGKVVSWGKY